MSQFLCFDQLVPILLTWLLVLVLHNGRACIAGCFNLLSKKALTQRWIEQARCLTCND